VSDHSLLEAVAHILRSTGDEVIRPRFRQLGRDEVSEKSPGEVVTIADEEAEARIADALGKLDG